MTNLPSEFEQALLARQPSFEACIECDDFTLRIAETLPYQLGLTFEWIRQHLGLRCEDISAIDGVVLRTIVSQCVVQTKRQIAEGVGGLWHIDIPYEAAARWLTDRFGLEADELMRFCKGDLNLCREYLRRKMTEAEMV